MSCGSCSSICCYNDISDINAGDARSGSEYHLLSQAPSDNFPLTLYPSEMVNFESSCDSYEKGGYLGSACGGFGCVWIATHKPSLQNVAIKIYNLDQCEDELELIQYEISMVNKLKSPYLIQYYASFTTEHDLWVVMPFYSYTSASHVMMKYFPNGFPEMVVALLIKDVLHGLKYLHSRAVIHRAIRGSHVLIDSKGSVLICGLRYCISCISDGVRQRSIHSYPHMACFNIQWSSPELLAQDVDGYSEKSDIYSTGIVVCELANGEVPYSNLEPAQILLEKLEGRIPFLYDTKTHHLLVEASQGLATDSGVGASVGTNLVSLATTDRSFSDAAHNFVNVTLVQNPDLRPSCDHLLRHSFIKQTKKFANFLSQLLLPALPVMEQSELDVGEVEDSLEKACLNNDTSWEFE